jgi:hypothetical protein
MGEIKGHPGTLLDFVTLNNQGKMKRELIPSLDPIDRCNTKLKQRMNNFGGSTCLLKLRGRGSRLQKSYFDVADAYFL